MKLPFLAKLDRHMREIVRGASVSMLLMGIGAVLNFGFNLILARLLGAEEAGIYFLTLTVIMVASTLGRVGLDRTILRFIAASASVEQWIEVKGIAQRGRRIALFGTSITAAIVFFSAPWLADVVFEEPFLRISLRWMSVAIIPLALMILQAQMLQGLKRIRDSVLVQNILPQGITLLLVIALAPVFGVRGAIIAYVGAVALASLIGFQLWRRAVPQLRSIVGFFDTRKILKSSSPLFWSSLLQLVILRAPTLVLGSYGTSADVGVFSVATRTALLVNFALLAVNSIAAPKFSALYHRGDHANLGRTARGSARLILLVAIPIAAPLLVFPNLIMGLFGQDFAGGGIILVILVLGKLVNVATGSVGFLLTMTGHERWVRNNMAFIAALSLAVTFALVPSLGVLGAAIAAAIALAVQNLLGLVLVRWKLGFWTLPW